MKGIWFFKKSKRGMATIIGMFIVVGILFTAVIPLFLYVNQVNNFYDETVEEMTSNDLTKVTESLTVVAYPTGENLTTLNFLVSNTGVIPVKIMRIWAIDLKNNTFKVWNETDIPDLQYELQPATQKTITGINITDFGTGERKLYIKLITERGRVFTSGSNPLWLSNEGWSGIYSRPYNIQFAFERPEKGGQSWKILGEINVTLLNHPTENYSEIVILDQHVIQGNVYLESIGVSFPGTYKVTVTLDSPNAIERVTTVILDQSNPLRWVWIDTD